MHTNYCVFLYVPKYGVTILETDLSKEEAQSEVENQIQQGEEYVQFLTHSAFERLFGFVPSAVFCC